MSDRTDLTMWDKVRFIQVDVYAFFLAEYDNCYTFFFPKGSGLLFGENNVVMLTYVTGNHLDSLAFEIIDDMEYDLATS
jgi:hypothetical protein